MSTSHDRNPIHTYSAAGIFTVSLTGVGRYNTDTVVKTNYITAYNPTYVLTATIHPTDSAVVTGLGEYPAGTSVTLTAIGEPKPAGDNYVDIVFLVDESGSMSTEHSWLTTMPSQLEAALLAAGIGTVTQNKYALMGYASTTNSDRAYKLVVGTGDWGTAVQLQAAALNLNTLGNIEDGYQAMDAALTGAGDTATGHGPYTFRVGAAVVFVLVTDSDRQGPNTLPGHSLTYASMLAELGSYNVILASCINARIRNVSNVDGIGKYGTALYLYSASSPYYTLGTFDHYTPSTDSQTANVIADYCNLTDTHGGSVWDLEILRNGGLYATAFSNAFTAVLTAQIVGALSWQFDHWIINGVTITSNPYTFTVTGSTTIDLYMI
jgi:PKD repeat protein